MPDSHQLGQRFFYGKSTVRLFYQVNYGALRFFNVPTRTPLRPLLPLVIVILWF